VGGGRGAPASRWEETLIIDGAKSGQQAAQNEKIQETFFRKDVVQGGGSLGFTTSITSKKERKRKSLLLVQTRKKKLGKPNAMFSWGERIIQVEWEGTWAHNSSKKRPDQTL